jgi:gliding motility-associated-like protein
MDIRPDNTATVECTPLADQEYTVNVTAKGDCPAIPMSFDVVVLRPVDSIPNAFSPNGDGINDKWIIPYLSSYPYATVQIFDRNGMLVFNTYGYNTAWDGTYNGKALPIGTYYYVIKLGQGLPTKTGYVVLLR